MNDGSTPTAAVSGGASLTLPRYEADKKARDEAEAVAYNLTNLAIFEKSQPQVIAKAGSEVRAPTATLSHESCPPLTVVPPLPCRIRVVHPAGSKAVAVHRARAAGPLPAVRVRGDIRGAATGGAQCQGGRAATAQRGAGGRATSQEGPSECVSKGEWGGRGAQAPELGDCGGVIPLECHVPSVTP